MFHLACIAGSRHADRDYERVNGVAVGPATAVLGYSGGAAFAPLDPSSGPSQLPRPQCGE